MPRLLEPHSRTDAVLQGARRVIAERGLTGFTLRAIAAESGISPSALSHQFTDRDRLVRTVVALLGRDRSADIGRRSWREGALAFLPTEEHLLDARVWLACCELGRSEHQVGEVVARVRQDDRELLDVLTDRRLGETGLDVVMASTSGREIHRPADEAGGWRAKVQRPDGRFIGRPMNLPRRRPGVSGAVVNALRPSPGFDALARPRASIASLAQPG